MERLIKGFKDLFKCENPVKCHLMYVLLLVLPAITGVFWESKDKLDYMWTMTIFFLCLSIIPVIYIFGFWMEFYELRLKGEIGIPKVNGGLFLKGLKTLPLVFAWGLYICIFCFPITVALIASMVIKNDPITLLPILSLATILLPVFGVCLLIITPFLNYVFAKFAKDYQYKAECFNPFVLIGFMKKSFKETMMVLLKMIVPNIIAVSVNLILFFVSVILLFIVGLFLPEQAKQDFAQQPLVIIVGAILVFLVSIIQSYIGNITTLIAADLYVEVYKNKIEPTENEVTV